MTPVHTAAQDPVAVIEGLRVEIGGRVVLDGVDLSLRPGRITALTGGSGSGKTTMGLALLGEYPAGSRVTGGVRVPQGLIGYVPQHPAAVLNPARRIGALLSDIARGRVRHLPRSRRRAAARERVLDALDRVRLPADGRLLRRFPHQLSGGQQQRVALAQVLLLGARVVVADEPTTGQDPLTKRGVVDLLADVARQGIAVLLLSHDTGVVRALADEVVVLRDGRVRDEGPAAASGRAPLGGAGRSDAVLDVRSLVARHGRTPVLDRVSLTVGAGECLAVVGRSGSGKTTLARCLSGLHPRHAGEVHLDGQPLPAGLRDRSRSQVAGVQYVFQDAKAAFDEYRPVVDQVARTAVRLRGAAPAVARRDALALLSALGLPAEKAARLPAHLSGGELQRAALARAALARPRVLVCDEITSGLDPVARDAVLGLLGGLLRSGRIEALVLITHDLGTAALADRIAVMEDGRVVESGAAGRVLGAPEHAFTRELVAAEGTFAVPGD
ncbi:MULTISPECIES: ATP-binding cassette domain-containing protein [unclassified Streptomyces]|uniref:ABC transporter ATP-binding protein n=1 Tax=unclassified Streptomyces TaxID=2593676 RepID=UPI002E2BC704|nr:ATP-binding cassette domain-containing protein [Streptomyces sp. NBC_01423]WSX94876.1 ATP-binding cassette domain-containing protein [Streptomyces sp. NBC_00891]WSY09356.1 ATP-binding cassette domain-containing protein [Streptomyces sp. NBC_00890]WSZ10978.1 ATP-binding cassette domain-containing protein [Streptomyces sp. NBC_00869]WSZ21518.1 ATP-binding cassette domain-containing protein [Streptomyces sp. NBC_00870]